MAIDSRIQALEDEYKVIKGELKQTLADVRDFLIDINLPAMQEQEEETPDIHERNESHSGEEGGKQQELQQGSPDSFGPLPPQPGGQPQAFPEASPRAQHFPSQEASQGPPPPMTVRFEGIPPSAGPAAAEEQGFPVFTPAADEASPEESGIQAEEMTPQPAEDNTDVLEEEDAMIGKQQYPQDIVASLQEEAREGKPVYEAPLPETSTQKHSRAGEEQMMGTGTEQVNVLVNLIRWVSAARAEIGDQQLPAFLDVYSIGGHLSAEARDTIMHLAEKIAPRRKNVYRGNGHAEPPCREHSSKYEEEPGEALAPSPGTDHYTPSKIDGTAGAENEMPVSPSAAAETWSRMIMELHGILVQGRAPFHPLQPVTSSTGDEAGQNDYFKEQPSGGKSDTQKEEAQESKEEDGQPSDEKIGARKKKSKKKTRASRKPKVAYLKLVLPAGDENEEEFNVGGFPIDTTSGNL
jgi:hypothetical protein